MGRSIRQFAVLAKAEVIYGTDPVPTGASNAMLVRNLNVNPLNANNVDRALIRPYFGASEQLIGVAYKEISFDVELVGGGSAGTAPAWGPLLEACGMTETIEAATRVDYTPVTDSLGSVTIYAHKSGVLHKLLGARGEWGISAEIGDIPLLNFRFQGLDGGDTATADATPTYTAFQVPQVVTNAFTPEFNLGGTVASSGAPAITSGTAFSSRGLRLQSGNALAHTALIGLEEMDITDRIVTGSLNLDMDAAAEVSKMTDVKANTLSTIAMRHGTVAGNKVLLYLPSVQFINPSNFELNGRLLNGYDLRCVPTSGNDEVRIVTSF